MDELTGSGADALREACETPTAPSSTTAAGAATHQNADAEQTAGAAHRGVVTDYHPATGALRREGSWLDTARRNVDIIELAVRIGREDRCATEDEQRQLSRYVGFGAADMRNMLFPVPTATAKAEDTARRIWPQLIHHPAWRELAERLDALPDEWQRSILQSTQYAHYTPECVVRAMWTALKRVGFAGGAVLDAGMGVGHFAMLMPADLAAASRYTGIEVDGPTATIARLLSPTQTVLHEDFTKTRLPRDYFDLVVGNPPFSPTKVYADPEYEKCGFVLHDFFLAKSLDLVRPGGMLAVVTSRNTLDKQRGKARAYLAARADLLGAIRLPSNAFAENAGTHVVTDVLFMRKRFPGEPATGSAWQRVVQIDTPDGPATVNEYFRDNPAMVLGQQRIPGRLDDADRVIRGCGRGDRYTVVGCDDTADALDVLLDAALGRLPQAVYGSRVDTPSHKGEAVCAGLPAPVGADFGCEGVIYLADDGTLVRIEQGIARRLDETMKLSVNDRAWFASYLTVRDHVEQARRAQAEDADWEAALARLNDVYDDFRRQHGPLNAYRVQIRRSAGEDGEPVEMPTRMFTNRRRFREDYASSLVTQLELIDESGEIVKAPFLLGRTIGRPVSRDVRTIADALAVSLDALGRLDLDDVARRIGLTRHEAIEALGSQVYRTPQGEWQLADEYLSGDVVAKLDEAEYAVRVDAELQRNVEALKRVQPEKLGPSQISVKLGASWIPVAHVNAFAAEIEAGSVSFDPTTESWEVDSANLRSRRNAGDLYGTDARSPSELLEAALNSRPVKVTKTDARGNSITDTTATTAANEVLNKIQDKFKSWIWTDADRVTEVLEIYNRRYNNLAPRQFDGSHLTLPGVSLSYRPYGHQLRGVWRIVQSGNTYLAHAMGSGKTMELAAAGMEQRRLGLIAKPMYVVPGHMLQQFATEFLHLYPLANILVADDDNFCAERRARFIANATLNNPDAIIITHDAFLRIGIRAESVAPIRDEILTDLEIELTETDDGSTGRVRRRQLQQQIEAVSQRFDRIIAHGRDAALTFEDLGVDFLLVDEAHLFRKLDFHTSQQIKGIDPHGSRRALDMYIKTRWLDRQRPGRSFVFASGTPVTNTMGELCTLMRFFIPDELKRAGIATFDAWSRQFGEVAATLEPNSAGRFEVVTRFAKFVNIPELMSRVRVFMDVLTDEYLAALVKRPALKGGKPNLNLVPASADLKHYMRAELGPRIERSRAWRPSKGQPANPDPIVAIITDGRFAAIDPRFFGGVPGPEGSIITVMAAKVAAEYHAGSDRVYRDEEGRPEPIKGSTQLVFFNLGFGAESMRNRGFDARAAFMKCLLAHGVPREHIGWFEDANTFLRKEAMFADMRSGRLRILIGSAKKMGTGANVQKRLAVLHYMDPPWYPADVAQPHGRILRPGNQNDEVTIEWYSTIGTYQSCMWLMVSRKQRFIDQAFTGDRSLRTIDDIGEASLFEQAAAVASGDPRAIRLAGLRQEVARFERLQAAHESEQINVRSALRSAQWALQTATAAFDQLDAAFLLLDRRHFKFVSAAVGDRSYEEQGVFGEALKNAFNAVARTGRAADRLRLAHLGGAVTITISGNCWPPDKPCEVYAMHVCVGDLSQRITATARLRKDVDAAALVQRIVNQINGIGTELVTLRSQRERAQIDIARLRRKAGLPFEYARDLAEKFAELKALEEALRLEDRTSETDPDTVASGAYAADAARVEAIAAGAAPGFIRTAAYDLFGIDADARALAASAAAFGTDPQRDAATRRRGTGAGRKSKAGDAAPLVAALGQDVVDLFGVFQARAANAAHAALFGGGGANPPRETVEETA